jgi:uridine kinase
VSREVAVDDVVARVRVLADGAPRPVFVGIDGLGGAGKSTLAQRLADKIGCVRVVHVDDFARPGVPGWEQARFEREVAQPLRSGREGRYQRWDWDSDTGAEWHTVPVDSVVVVEGVSSTRAEVAVPWSLTVWVDTPPDVRLARGVERDGEALRAQWEQVWMPEEDAYIDAQSPHLRADLLVRGF